MRAVCCFQLIIPATVTNHSLKHVQLLEYTGIVKMGFTLCSRSENAVITLVCIKFHKKDKIDIHKVF